MADHDALHVQFSNHFFFFHSNSSVSKLTRVVSLLQREDGFSRVIKWEVIKSRDWVVVAFECYYTLILFKCFPDTCMALKLIAFQWTSVSGHMVCTFTGDSSTEKADFHFSGITCGMRKGLLRFSVTMVYTLHAGAHPICSPFSLLKRTSQNPLQSHAAMLH